MKCGRCDIQFSATSAMVTDHKYVQECIDALKGEVRRLSSPGPCATVEPHPISNEWVTTNRPILTTAIPRMEMVGENHWIIRWDTP